MGKNCVPSAYRRGTSRGTGSSAGRKSSPTLNAPQLEEKLDRLMNLLSSQQNKGEVAAGISIHNSAAASISSTIHSPAPSSTTLTNGAETVPGWSIIDNISAQDAESRLRIFRDKMLPFFPIIHSPPHISAQQLHAEKPFLWLSIMCVAGPTTPDQMALGEKLRSTIAEEVVLKSRKSLDFLIGLVVFLGW